MKYISIKTVEMALHRIAGSRQEHTTGTAASGLLQHYFPLNKYITTPEQIKYFSNRKPDFSVERLKNNTYFTPHLFVEIKSLINSNFNEILDQLYDTILHTVDHNDFSVFIIAMKGTKIAFFEFHSFVSLLDEHGIENYMGFMPLNYRMPAQMYFEINEEQGISNLINFLKYRTELNIPVEELNRLGV